MNFIANFMKTSRTRAEGSDQNNSLITYSLERPVLYFYYFQNTTVQYQLYRPSHRGIFMPVTGLYITLLCFAHKNIS